MTPSAVYRRAWSTVAAVATTALAVVGVVETGPSHLAALGCAAAATTLAGTVWVATTPQRDPSTPAAAPAHRLPMVTRDTLVRRAAALPPVALLAVVGAGHLGPLAALVVVVLLLTCPWLIASLRSPGRGPGPSL